MSNYSISIRTTKGKRIFLTGDYWQHIIFRHPEVLVYRSEISKAVSDPDEVYEDERKGTHSLKRIDKNHFLVVIYELETDNEGFIRTAYIINETRKKRRYRELRFLKPS